LFVVLTWSHCCFCFISVSFEPATGLFVVLT
jgi:hypothetical protein